MLWMRLVAFIKSTIQAFFHFFGYHISRVEPVAAIEPQAIEQGPAQATEREIESAQATEPETSHPIPPAQGIQIFLNNVCNFMCPSCPQSIHKTPKGNVHDIDCGMIFDNVELINLEQVSFTARGEPIISFDIMIKIMDYFLNRKNDLSFSLVTNGSLLTEEKYLELKKRHLNCITLSVDGWQEDYYIINRQSRNGKNYFKHIRELINFTESTPLIINFLPVYDNVMSISEMVKDVMKYPLVNINFLYMVHPDLYFESAAIYCSTFPEENAKWVARYRELYAKSIVMPEMLHIAREAYLEFPNRIHFPTPMCGGIVDQLTINLNGDLTPCCYAPFTIGNIINEGYLTVLRKFRDYQEILRTNSINMNNNCRRCLQISEAESQIRLNTINEIGKFD